METILEDTTSKVLADAIDANLIEKSLSFARYFKGELYGPNPCWFITGAAMDYNNGVASATFAPGAVDTGITPPLAPFQQRNLPLTWWVGPRSAPSNLGQALQRHGLSHDRDMIGMAMDMRALADTPAPLPGLTFEQVRDRPALAEWYNLMLQGFPINFSQTYLDALAATSLEVDTGWVHYIGRLGGDVITISSLFLGGGVAGLYNLTTVPTLRGQGIGAWMTVKTFLEARARTYRIATLQTTYPNALRLYHKLGFEVYCKIGVYRYPAQ